MPSKYFLAVLVLMVIYAAFFAKYSIERTYALYETRGNYGVDTEIFYQSFLSTIEGGGFFYNDHEYNRFGATSHFGVHNSPILLLILPIFALFPYIETLLIIQTLAVTLSILTFFKFSRSILDEKSAFIVSIIYMINPMLHGINRFEFHAVSLALPLIFIFAYFYEKGSLKLTIAFALLVLTVREDSFLILLSLMVLRALREERRFDLMEKLIFASSILWPAFSIFFVIPHFAPKYPHLSNYTLGVPHPYLSLMLIIVIFLSFGLIPLLKLRYVLPGVPLLLELILSKRFQYVVFWNHYCYMIVSYFAIATVYTLKEQKSKKILVYALILAFLTFLVSSPAVHEGLPLVFDVRIPPELLLFY
ncbi:DUF2079 domain-containing protein [Pyrococcus kukulkanii]|uniref:DUF2079 domain-containing protein n=1 Tax=Pyrococcus kukulkanii TaxID=1609559 RepID=A0A127B9Q3_9EURY|nr:DUF2079 domain-containing protein [Pyrococcus kukulkanii]AMM54058.1 hypothetical protein TQ32_05910 [Pyrococcus kukulkanii]